jgi:hypothetical protein
MFEPTLLRVPFDEWYCPNGCYCTETTPALPPNATRFHNCPKLHSLSAPLERVGTDCTVEAVEREDYLGSEIQATGDDGKPYMSIITRYPDGRQGLVANPGLATGKIGA